MLYLIFPAQCYSHQEAENKVSEAENKILDCYQAAFEAEKAGANISELLTTINEAGRLLSIAKLSYEYGDYDSAVELANQTLTILDGFIDEANALNKNAKQSGFFDFTVNFVGSAVGAVAIFVGGYAGWILLKRREKGVKFENR